MQCSLVLKLFEKRVHSTAYHHLDGFKYHEAFGHNYCSIIIITKLTILTHFFWILIIDTNLSTWLILSGNYRSGTGESIMIKIIIWRLRGISQLQVINPRISNIYFMPEITIITILRLSISCVKLGVIYILLGTACSVMNNWHDIWNIQKTVRFCQN